VILGPVEAAQSDNPDPLRAERAFRRPIAASGDKPADATRVWASERVVGEGDGEVIRIASRQRGFIHRRQLIAARLSRDAIAHRLVTGWLSAYLPCVYLVGRRTLEPLGRETAAVLHCDGRGVLSHATAAACWGLVETSAQVTVTLIAHNAHPRAGIELHRTCQLHPRDLRLHHGLPVTAPARTLIDLAAVAPAAALERALAEARVQRLIRPGDLEAAIARVPHRKGVGAIKALLAAEHDPAFTRRELERRFLALVRGAQLPPPRVNARVHGFEVDFLWAEQRLVVETDGHQFHGHRGAFERDRRRDQVLVAAGYRVMRITWRQLCEEPLAVVARVTMALAHPAA
jgi:very-short-patch-repair endonuclease